MVAASPSLYRDSTYRIDVAAVGKVYRQYRGSGRPRYKVQKKQSRPKDRSRLKRSPFQVDQTAAVVSARRRGWPARPASAQSLPAGAEKMNSSSRVDEYPGSLFAVGTAQHIHARALTSTVEPGAAHLLARPR